MHILEFLAMLRKRWIYVVAPVIVGVAAAILSSITTTPIYQASASVYFSLPFGASANDLFQGSNYTQKQLASYATLATLPVVLQPVIDQLQLDITPAQLANSVQAVASNDTVIIDIRASSPDAQRAADISNAVAQRLGTEVQNLAPKSADGSPSVDVSVVAAAVPPQYPVTPNTRRNVAIGGLAGVFLGILLALARDRFDTRVRGVRDLPEGLTVLATVPFDRQARQSPLITARKSRTGSGRTEVFRTLRTNLQFFDVGQSSKVFVITSALPGEGKSSTSANLGIVFADAGNRVLLIDADLRRPQLAEYMGVEGGVGLSNVLAGQVDAGSAIQPWGRGTLSVLASGAIPPNPSELLGSGPMRELMHSLREQFDLIIIDAPPLLPVTDAVVVSAFTDGVVLVVRSGSTKRNQVATALRAVQAVDARVLGAVLNMTSLNSSDVGHYGYGGYSRSDLGSAEDSTPQADGGAGSDAPATGTLVDASWADAVVDGRTQTPAPRPTGRAERRGLRRPDA